MDYRNNIGSKPDLHLNDLMNNQDFLGDLLQVGKSLRKKSDLKVELEEIFKEINTSSQIKEIIDEIDNETLDQILEEAEYLCVDKIIGGD